MHKKCLCKILVIKNGGNPLIGRDILNMLNIGVSELNNTVYHIDTNSDNMTNLIKNYFELLNDEIGCYKFGKIKLELQDINIKPVFCKPRTVPISLQSEVNAQLDLQIKNGLLKEIKHSDWGTPLVPVLQKEGGIRLCADYKSTINRLLKDFHYPLPRIEDLFAALQGGQKFTKLDIKNAYNQLELDEESQLLLAWSTHKGIFAPTRLTFGTKPACSHFQAIMAKTLLGCSGVVCFLDDILVTGSFTEEHCLWLKNYWKLDLD